MLSKIIGNYLPNGLNTGHAWKICKKVKKKAACFRLTYGLSCNDYRVVTLLFNCTKLL